MKHILSAGIKLYQNNGLLGVGLSKIGLLRAGANDDGRIPPNGGFPKSPSSTTKISLAAQEIDEILNDDRIAEEQKKVIPYSS